MILTVASHKGGVGKTTTAVHLAGYLAKSAPTALIDGDPNRSASGWAKRGALPFPVLDERGAMRATRHFDNLVFDTQARPSDEDLRELAEGCDLLIIPTTPDALGLHALMQTTTALEKLRGRYRILLTIIPPRPSRDAEEARTALSELQVPVFTSGIRRLVAFQKAACDGKLVDAVDDPRAPAAWIDYLTLGKEVAEWADSPKS